MSFKLSPKFSIKLWVRFSILLGTLILTGCAATGTTGTTEPNNLSLWDRGADCEGPFPARNGYQNCGLGKGR
ncbi:hypothetical protein [Pelagibaculum spongiae]|nr:hypothetical protein [Pelagibaculum spongiae]